MIAKQNLQPSHIECFKKLQAVSRENKVDYMLVGANARDIIFEHYIGITSQRLTYDIDIGLSVDSWEAFHQFKASLIELGFEANTKSQQRLSYRPSGASSDIENVQLDIVPHGGINNPNNEIDWPPDGSTTMSVLGFQEAYDSALTISIDDDLDIPVISAPGLGLLKLIAWIDRPSNLRQKDALDMKFSLLHYDALPNIHEATFDEGFAERYEFKMHKAIAAKFGSDVRNISSQPCSDFIIENLFANSQEDVFERFIFDMSQRDESQLQTNYDMFDAFRYGFLKKTVLV